MKNYERNQLRKNYERNYERNQNYAQVFLKKKTELTTCSVGLILNWLFLSPPSAAWLPMCFLISLAIVMNACSTFVEFLADVSRNGIPIESAYSYINKVLLDLKSSKISLFVYFECSTEPADRQILPALELLPIKLCSNNIREPKVHWWAFLTIKVLKTALKFSSNFL